MSKNNEVEQKQKDLETPEMQQENDENQAPAEVIEPEAKKSTGKKILTHALTFVTGVVLGVLIGGRRSATGPIADVSATPVVDPATNVTNL